MSELDIITPAGWPRAPGYSHAVAGRGRLVFVAGQIGWTPDQRWETDDLVGQLRQALANTLAILAAAGARPQHIARMTWYVLDRQEYLARRPEIGRCWRKLMGRHFPAMALVEVSALVEARAKLEIETTALIPDEA
ncbi:MAG TPA: RidA family protein [Stellaceae bacterium]|nr:RidA family protein [Stellaceae bacterium]